MAPCLFYLKFLTKKCIFQHEWHFLLFSTNSARSIQNVSIVALEYFWRDFLFLNLLGLVLVASLPGNIKLPTEICKCLLHLLCLVLRASAMYSDWIGISFFPHRGPNGITHRSYIAQWQWDLLRCPPLPGQEGEVSIRRPLVNTVKSLLVIELYCKCFFLMDISPLKKKLRFGNLTTVRPPHPGALMAWVTSHAAIWATFMPELTALSTSHTLWGSCAEATAVCCKSSARHRKARP